MTYLLKYAPSYSSYHDFMIKYNDPLILKAFYIKNPEANDECLDNCFIIKHIQSDSYNSPYIFHMNKDVLIIFSEDIDITNRETLLKFQLYFQKELRDMIEKMSEFSQEILNLDEISNKITKIISPINFNESDKSSLVMISSEFVSTMFLNSHPIIGEIAQKENILKEVVRPYFDRAFVNIFSKYLSKIDIKINKKNFRKKKF
jgi:hypothetical protein